MKNSSAKFFISDTKKLDSKYGKWYYQTEGCQIYKINGRLIIYFGYTIDKPIHEYIETNPYALKNANGKYCVVILEKNTMQVIVDYFCQTKIFYRNTNRIEVTNQIYMMPLTSGDIDHKELNIRKNPKHIYRSAIKQYNKDITKTIWKDVYILQPDHCIVVDKKLTIKRIHDTLKKNIESFNSNNRFQTTIDPYNNIHFPFRSSIEAEDYIHTCMEQHADVIKKTYKNVVTTISEGVDSVLIDQYFPDAKRIMYDLEPPTGPFEYKQKIINDYNLRNIPIEMYTMQQSQLGELAAATLNDPDCYLLDGLPTYAQVKQLKHNADILLFGQNGDQMFMHRPTFLYAYLFSTQLNTKKTTQQIIEEYKDCYSATKNMWPDKKYKLHNEVEKTKGLDWKEFFAYETLPDLYNREVEHCINIPTTSLYCDKRIFNLVHQLPEDIMFENVKDATIQKNILKRKFNYSFLTPTKDGASFEILPMVVPMLKATIANCLKDHLSKA